ncbi:MAG: ATP synthase F1 subunit delta [Bacteroidetes bacterium]|nr:ATP synthase F1 subunit delta [Bacteroidota bacterium]
MNLSHIAVPYAKAFFEVALEQHSLEEAMQDMKLIQNICKTSRELRLLLKSPIVTTDRKSKIVRLIFEDKISKLTISFLLIILRKRRENIIPDLADEFLELYKDYKGILTTYLKTAYPVSEEVRQKIIAVLKQQTNKEIELFEETNEEIIGGFILRWKDQQYDASILKQLNKLKHEIASINLFVKGF